jgi:ornithine carbamoyltransferase
MHDLIDIDDIERKDVETVMKTAERMKSDPERFSRTLEDRTLLMLFEKPSTRTRVSFEAGMTQLGGHAINFEMDQSQMSRGESMHDTAKVLSRYCDAIMARLYDHGKIKELRDAADVPVINGLTDLLHPCQALGDAFTIQEQGLDLQEMKIAYVGDGNNVCHSLLQVAGRLGIDMTVGSPEGYEPDDKILGRARASANRKDASIRVANDPLRAVMDADVVYTDVWVSMGDEAGGDAAASESTRSEGSVREDEEKRKEDLRPYQVNEDLLRHASDDVKVMHCLPAHRGEEITSEVLDGEHSIVFDQAENRMHVQKALLDTLINTA